jgi:hypothetical protein
MTSTKITEIWKNEEKLLVDHEHGVLLGIPATGVVSRRYCESHQFIRVLGDHLVAGPDAERVANGNGGEHYVTYQIVAESDGVLSIKRDS